MVGSTEKHGRQKSGPVAITLQVRNLIISVEQEIPLQVLQEKKYIFSNRV